MSSTEFLLVGMVVFVTLMWLIERTRANFYRRQADREMRTAARYFALLNPDQPKGDANDPTD